MLVLINHMSFHNQYFYPWQHLCVYDYGYCCWLDIPHWNRWGYIPLRTGTSRLVKELSMQVAATKSVELSYLLRGRRSVLAWPHVCHSYPMSLAYSLWLLLSLRCRFSTRNFVFARTYRLYLVLLHATHIELSCYVRLFGLTHVRWPDHHDKPIWR